MAISPNPTTQSTEQGILNTSFDKTNQVLAVELVGYDSVNNNLVRIASNSNGELVAGTRITGTASATDTTSTSVITAGAAGVKNYIRSVQVANTGATTVSITLQDGSGGTALARTIAPAGGGSNIRFDPPIATTAATALFFAAGGSSTTVYVSAQGYQAA